MQGRWKPYEVGDAVEVEANDSVLHGLVGCITEVDHDSVSGHSLLTVVALEEYDGECFDLDDILYPFEVSRVLCKSS